MIYDEVTGAKSGRFNFYDFKNMLNNIEFEQDLENRNNKID